MVASPAVSQQKQGEPAPAQLESRWPGHFPKVACPPADARALSDSVYRIADTWESFLEQERAKGCRAASLSCYLALEDALAARALHDYWNDVPVVCATLSTEHGVIKQTGQSPKHHSVWLTRAALAEAPALFKAAT